MTVSGHINSDDIVYTMLQGDNNNKVHNFLIEFKLLNIIEKELD